VKGIQTLACCQVVSTGTILFIQGASSANFDPPPPQKKKKNSGYNTTDSELYGSYMKRYEPNCVHHHGRCVENMKTPDRKLAVK